jgi:hypothetical protein
VPVQQFAWKHVNQFAFNLAVGRPTRPVRVQTLDRFAFPSGNVWNSSNERVRTLVRARHMVMHANYVMGAELKREMMQGAGLWAPVARAWLASHGK